MPELKCPIYNTTNACNQNPNCLFLRRAGCAVVIGTQAAFENQEKINHLTQQLNGISNQLRDIALNMNRR